MSQEMGPEGTRPGLNPTGMDPHMNLGNMRPRCMDTDGNPGK
jgi:hypothetical protein